MSRIPDDFDPALVRPKDDPDDDGPPTRDLKPLRPDSTAPKSGRHPKAKLDLDRAEEILDIPAPEARRPASA